MKIKLDENGKVVSILNVGIDNDYIDAPELPDDHEFGVSDYKYLDGKYNKVDAVAINEMTVGEIVPDKISKLQLKVQLVMMGYDLQLIEDAIKRLTEPHRTIAMLAWTDATNIHRDNSFITMVAQILQLTEKQVDQIFIEGDKIKL